MKNSFEVEFEVYCSECGEGLEVSETNNNVSVEPCKKCIEKAYNEGIRDGSKNE